ncbi:MAG: alginate export family protein [bacterium]|nr:alginate export family protein [bacterium]
MAFFIQHFMNSRRSKNGLRAAQNLYSRTLVLSVLMLAIATPVMAQDSAGSDSDGESGEFSDEGGWLETWLDGFSMHGALQFQPLYAGNYDFRRSTDDNNELVGQKIQFGFEKTFQSRYTARVTAQDSRVWGGTPGSDTGLNTANNATNESLDLREAWLHADRLIGPVDVRLGRQILKFGDGRLVGTNEWGNVGRSFDTARFRFKSSIYEVDAWASVLAEEDSDNGGNTTAVGRSQASNFNISCDATGTSCQIRAGTPNELDDAYFTGLYNRFRFSEHFFLDAYYLGVHKKYINTSVPIINFPGATVTTEDRSRQRDNLYTFGGRATNATAGNRKAVIPFDWTVEYAWQTGITGREQDASWDYLQVSVPRVDPLTGAPLLDGAGQALNQRVYKEKERYDAFAFEADAGVTLFDTVRIGGEYAVASGDPNRNDGAHATFQNLFADGHNVFGISDIQGWQNMIGRSANLTFFFGAFGKLQLTYWEVDKHRAQDGWYDALGRLRSGATTESIANNRYLDTVNADGTTSLASGSLRKHLYREYDLLYQVNYDGIFFELGYALIHAGDSIGAINGDIFRFPGTRQPDFDPRANRIFMTVKYKF